MINKQLFEFALINFTFQMQGWGVAFFCFISGNLLVNLYPFLSFMYLFPYVLLLLRVDHKITYFSLFHDDSEFILSGGDVSVCGDNITIEFWVIVIESILGNDVPVGFGLFGTHDQWVL